MGRPAVFDGLLIATGRDAESIRAVTLVVVRGVTMRRLWHALEEWPHSLSACHSRRMVTPRTTTSVTALMDSASRPVAISRPSKTAGRPIFYLRPDSPSRHDFSGPFIPPYRLL